MPTVSTPAASSVPNQAAMPSTPGAPALTSSQPSPNCWEAWSQYLPSVQHNARSFRTTAVPALPVKPLAKALLSKQGATYSLKCGSSLGITNASTLFLSSSSRNASSVFVEPARRRTLRLEMERAAARPRARQAAAVSRYMYSIGSTAQQAVCMLSVSMCSLWQQKCTSC